jgi:hypothetical protein
MSDESRDSIRPKKKTKKKEDRTVHGLWAAWPSQIEFDQYAEKTEGTNSVFSRSVQEWNNSIADDKNLMAALKAAALGGGDWNLLMVATIQLSSPCCSWRREVQ